MPCFVQANHWCLAHQASRDRPLRSWTCLCNCPCLPAGQGNQDARPAQRGHRAGAHRGVPGAHRRAAGREQAAQSAPGSGGERMLCVGAIAEAPGLLMGDCCRVCIVHTDSQRVGIPLRLLAALSCAGAQLVPQPTETFPFLLFIVRVVTASYVLCRGAAPFPLPAETSLRSGRPPPAACPLCCARTAAPPAACCCVRRAPAGRARGGPTARAARRNSGWSAHWGCWRRPTRSGWSCSAPSLRQRMASSGGLGLHHRFT